MTPEQLLELMESLRILSLAPGDGFGDSPPRLYLVKVPAGLNWTEARLGLVGAGTGYATLGEAQRARAEQILRAVYDSYAWQRK
jgi:hypothetical protein